MNTAEQLNAITRKPVTITLNGRDFLCPPLLIVEALAWQEVAADAMREAARLQPLLESGLDERAALEHAPDIYRLVGRLVKAVLAYPGTIITEQLLDEAGVDLPGLVTAVQKLWEANDPLARKRTPVATT